MTLADAFNPLLARLRSRLAQTPLPQFWRWWTGELLSFLPPRWREALAVEQACLLLSAHGDGLSLELERAGQRSPLLQLDGERDAWGQRFAADVDDNLRALPLILGLPVARVLRRVLSLPVAALENLDAVLGFELDRQTPFKPEQVYFASRVLRQDAGAKQAQVELIVVTRPVLEEAVAGLAGLAERLAAVDVIDAHGQRLGVNLLPAERRASQPRTQPLIQLGLLCASIMLVFFGLGQVVGNRQAAVAEMEELVQAQRERAREVGALRAQLEESATAANFLAVQKQTQASMVLLLDELTQRLPDDTFLTRLSVSGNQVSLSGYSSQALKLVAELQKSVVLKDAALSGGVQPEVRVARDMFTINASYGPDPKAEP
ncbi:PilN domain-containing protein [Aquimonas voraii]|uniref:General secretion pathway protein L n=1 Tax=Aquimonas voraii TaxID=265719 RepID=A0A1G6ZE68_9GAMM|nr:PilN domain-containing protein [Aquimonas voraii]SDE00918.1 general secretion pathway protein L [Aquimonas voraii]